MTAGARVARAAGLAVAALLLTAVATYVAGEQTEVVVLRTTDASGQAHETKMWIVDEGDAPWVRVANPGRAWFRRLSANPRVELVRGGAARQVIARPHDTPDDRARVDALFREKYGITDWWYGVLLRRHPVPIRLDPVS